MNCSPPGPLSMEFSRQEYWRGLRCPPPEDPPDPEIEPASPAAMALKVDSVELSHQGSHHPCHIYICTQIFMLQTGENWGMGGVVLKSQFINPLMLPRWLSGKEPTCQFRRHEFDPWVRKIPWSRKWQSTPVFLPGKSHGQRLVGYSL